MDLLRFDPDGVGVSTGVLAGEIFGDAIGESGPATELLISDSKRSTEAGGTLLMLVLLALDLGALLGLLPPLPLLLLLLPPPPPPPPPPVPRLGTSGEGGALPGSARSISSGPPPILAAPTTMESSLLTLPPVLAWTTGLPPALSAGLGEEDRLVAAWVLLPVRLLVLLLLLVRRAARCRNRRDSRCLAAASTGWASAAAAALAFAAVPRGLRFSRPAACSPRAAASPTP
jgi:hypothetical protein